MRVDISNKDLLDLIGTVNQEKEDLISAIYTWKNKAENAEMRVQDAETRIQKLQLQLEQLNNIHNKNILSDPKVALEIVKKIIDLCTIPVEKEKERYVPMVKAIRALTNCGLTDIKMFLANNYNSLVGIDKKEIQLESETAPLCLPPAALK